MSDFLATHRGPSMEDLPFIYSTWLRNYRYSSTGFTQPIDKEIYYEYHNLVIRGIIERGCSILVCADRLDSKVIYGYLIYEDSKLGRIFHYGYVKKAFRGLGIFRYMTKEARFNPLESIYTHQTEDVKKMVAKNGWTCRYNPYLIG